MIDCIFTIDYEIYGNGEGSLRELVYEPTQKFVFCIFIAAISYYVIERPFTKLRHQFGSRASG